MTVDAEMVSTTSRVTNSAASNRNIHCTCPEDGPFHITMAHGGTFTTPSPGEGPRERGINWGRQPWKPLPPYPCPTEIPNNGAMPG